jgi:hypothetical protein
VVGLVLHDVPDAGAATAAFGRIRDAWRDAGRTDSPHISASLWYALGDGARERLRGYAFDYLRIFGDDMAGAMADSANASSSEALRAAVGDLDAAGCDELFLVPTTADPSELDRTRDALRI